MVKETTALTLVNNTFFSVLNESRLKDVARLEKEEEARGEG